LKPALFEDDTHVYLVGPVTPFNASDHEIEEFAFAETLRKSAPNEHIGWMRGQYVEADRPNRNGAQWDATELSFKHVTARLMPVTVMHDPRTAVGLLADTKLVTPQSDPSAPVMRVDSTLGIWKHRFREAWEEAQENYRQGQLMQSMECLKEYYDCSVCGTRYPCLPGGAERAQWCAHLRGEGSSEAARRLGNVTFTGVGLIYGTRGAKGALDTAHLELEEVAEFHEKGRRDRAQKPTKPRRRKGIMDIEDRDYQELLAAKGERDQLKERLATLEPEAAKVPDLEKKVETAEAEKVKAESERDELKGKVEQAEEQARATALASGRLEKLGKDFIGKLPDFTKGRVEEQAKTMSDEDWDARLKELEDAYGDRAAGAGGSEAGRQAGEVSGEELAAAGSAGGNGGNGNGGQSPEARRAVMAGLVPRKQ
jgi:hypothetical protein